MGFTRQKSTPLVVTMTLLVAISTRWGCCRAFQPLVRSSSALSSRLFSTAEEMSSTTAAVNNSNEAPQQKVKPLTVNYSMEEIVGLCKRRGLIFPSSEIYNGYAGFYDYGPIGVELKKQVKDAWWRTFVTQREDVVGLDSSIIHNPTTWKSSGTWRRVATTVTMWMIHFGHCTLRTKCLYLRVPEGCSTFFFVSTLRLFERHSYLLSLISMLVRVYVFKFIKYFQSWFRHGA